MARSLSAETLNIDWILARATRRSSRHFPALRADLPYAHARMDTQRPDSHAVRCLFDAVADDFAAHDFVHRRTFDGLLERLQPMQVEPRRILDLGCAVGDGSRALTKRFRRARVVSVDLAARMLQAARRGRPRFLSRRAEVQADAHRLPFPVGCFDLIVANQLLPWIENPDPVFAEIARTLRQEGLLLFSSLGPDSYAELRGAAPSPFPDMHDVGDGLVRSGLKDPVLDVEQLRINYSSGDKLVADLRGSGVLPITGVSGDDTAGVIAAKDITLELVFGHAWGDGPPNPPGEYRLEPGNIGRRRR